jgi:hypothetical protein
MPLKPGPSRQEKHRKPLDTEVFRNILPADAFPKQQTVFVNPLYYASGIDSPAATGECEC